MEELKQIGIGIGGMGTLVAVLVVLIKNGWLKIKIGTNGEVDKKTLAADVAELVKTNHLHEWENEMKEIKEDIKGIHIELSTMNRRIGFLEGRINAK